MVSGDASKFLKQLSMNKTWERSHSPYLFFNEDGESFTSLGFTAKRGNFLMVLILSMQLFIGLLIDHRNRFLNFITINLDVHTSQRSVRNDKTCMLYIINSLIGNAT